MKRALTALFFCLSICFYGLCGNKLPSGTGDFKFCMTTDGFNDTIQVFYHIPADFDRAGMPVVMGFHGNDRDCSYWVNTWKEYADRDGFMFFIPWFTHKDFPTRRYQELGVRNENGDFTVPKERTSALVDSIINYVIKASGTGHDKVTVYGHSAGGQFVHRYMLVNDSPFVGKAIIGNPGWFTFPTCNEPYSYGLKDFPEIDNNRIRNMLAKNVILQLAEGDTIRESFLRKTPEADRQGLNRLERGNRFFDTLESIADDKNWDFNWRKVYVPEVGHDAVGMSRHAAEFLLNDSITVHIPGEPSVTMASDWMHRFDDELKQLVENSDSDRDTVCDAVFIGSSSIRLWPDLKGSMKPLNVKQRGYGGAMLRDLGINYRRIMAHYRPKAIVFYCDNDICGWKEGDLNVSQVSSLYREFIERLNHDYPDAMVYFLSIKHSLSRKELRPQQEQLNTYMAQYASQNQRLAFVDLTSLLLKENRDINDSLFMDDHLHLNRNGYKLWNEKLLPLLIKQCKQ